MISPSATNPKLTAQGYKYIFRVVTSDERMGSVLGAYAVNTLKFKNIAVVDDRTAYGQGVADEFSKGAIASGATIVAKQFTNDKATDFSAILTAIKAKQPDVIFYGGMDAVGGPMLRQARQLGINVKLMGGDGMCTGSLPKLTGDSLKDDDVVCAENGGVDAVEKKRLEGFKATYQKRYGIPVVYNAAYAYDAMMVIALAMQKAGSSEPKVYLPALTQIEYKGNTGTISFDDKGDIKGGAVSILTYKTGHHSLLSLVK